MIANERSAYWRVKEIEAVIKFISECCYFNKEEETKTKDLYELYINWCKNTGNEFCLIGKNKFVSIMEKNINMKSKVISSYRTNEHRGWRGIGVKYDRA